MVKDGEIDWEKLRYTTRKAVNFLDNVIDANKYPLIEIELMSKRVRRIGLGVMGFADMLILLGIPYNSPYALKVAESVMKFITDEARQMSVELAKERGSFPEFKNSIWAKMGYECMRNSTVTTVAPTGTIAIIAGGCSQGIEPLFSIAYVRAVGRSLGHDLVEVSPMFEKLAIKGGFYSDDLIKKIAQMPSIQNLGEVPPEVRKLFVTAFDLAPEWHVRIQAAFQKYTDNAVSKTINFPNFATPHDIEKAYTLSYDLGCKGITVYRDGSKSFQVLNVGNNGNQQQISVPVSESGMIEFKEKCETCSSS
jgi:ribonucleoside-diphosphate reductase alpha chain